MEIGKLNQRITILENRTEIDEIGNHTPRWDEVFSLWAMVTVKNSSENTDAGVTKEVQKTEFLIRMHPELCSADSTTHCIKFRDIFYDISAIIPYYNNPAYMKIIATARKAGGENGNSCIY
ncbi:MAG: phage head closure protein [Ruminococcus flavefaciens]|nr:phage head closure protein [Ruminococcus flavefaciens]